MFIIPKSTSNSVAKRPERPTLWTECAGLETKAGQQEANCF